MTNSVGYGIITTEYAFNVLQCSQPHPHLCIAKGPAVNFQY